MKLRKTVEMSIEEAQDDFCYRYETCGVCPLNKKAPSDCLAWCVAHPHEAARLMGYEVVEDGQYICPSCGNALPENPIGGYTCPYCGYGERTEKKEANMDKPLKDWTLGDLKEWCYQYRKAHTNNPCEQNCPIYQRGICCNKWVHEWDLEEKPRWTEQEVEDAKAIKRVLKATGIRRNRYDNIYATGELIVDTLLDSEAFPSLQPDTAVTIDEIIGGAQ